MFRFSMALNFTQLPVAIWVKFSQEYLPFWRTWSCVCRAPKLGVPFVTGTVTGVDGKELSRTESLPPRDSEADGKNGCITRQFRQIAMWPVIGRSYRIQGCNTLDQGLRKASWRR